MHVAMQPLMGTDAVCEVWYSNQSLAEGRYDDIRYRCDAEMLFGVIVLAETDFAGAVPLQHATETAYSQIASLLANLNYPYVVRYWNYMADINVQTYQLERYRQFNLGRQSGLLAQGRTVGGNVPAACALGTVSGDLSIAFLASRIAPVAIENPRQLSAYAYPQSYGPRSPSFSRASLTTLAGQEWLFISGTASIVGHASVHGGDVRAQTRETVINLIAVLEQANRLAHPIQFDLSGLKFKVYLRYPTDLESVQAELKDMIGSLPDAIYLQADICRQELLIEIEATSRPVLTSIPESGSDHACFFI
ncbi:MAG: chorismate transformation enzyme, FkbO/Hyg5 family [Sulfuriferula sp.]